jgi:4-hydroxythreonine-4-phosphate dehydrogenase
MMVLGSFRVVHVTSHIPLKAVYKYISSGNVFKIIELTSNSLKKMGIRKPQIAVCGLNPHAGDKGILGTEEKYISMAIKMANKKKINATGPLAADFLWPQVVSGKFDVGIAMYHDQGQIPIKLLGTKITKTGQWNVQGVNVTLGLPFIRTSVAHGTAHDIAGKNKASETSLVNAIHTALQMISC